MSEANISLSSKSNNVSLTGLIPSLTLPTQGEGYKKKASVCFITDTGACSDNKFGNSEDVSDGNGNPGRNPEYDTPAEQCRDAGYTQSPCPEGSHPVSCPADSSYHTCSCADEYNKTCEKPYYGIGDSCGGQYKQCKKDTERACREENPEFTNYCQNGWQMGNEKCSYDPTFGICCNTCVGYNYTQNTVPNGYVTDGEPCLNCSGDEVYKIKPNPCDGFQDCGSMGPESGAQSCLSGTVTKYDNCKPCPKQGNLTACPTGYRCEYEDCSNKYYKVDGCQSGYDWDAAAKTCTEHCYYACSLTTCPDNADCEYEACSGKYCLIGCNRNFSYNSDTDTCTCVERPPLYTSGSNAYTYGEENCNDFYKLDYTGCYGLKSMHACANGLAAKISSNPKCSYLPERGMYGVTFYYNYYGCTNESGEEIYVDKTASSYCDASDPLEDEIAHKFFTNDDKCKEYIATLPEKIISGIGECGPCRY
ncbi:MAG: hypothetical protein Q4F75_08215 [Pseudomonadota bacterium]|nr:hypothetical protein [Pseudomonadota bacterium]